MPTYKETVYWSYKTYPSLFVNELDVLNHLFFVIGNGYSWVDGELIERHEGSFEENFERVQKRRNSRNERLGSEILINIPCGNDDLYESFRDLIESDDVEVEQKKEVKRRNKRKTEMGKKIEEPNKIYPIYEFSKIMNLPDDIKPDWLEAAKKAIQYANEGKWILTESDKSYILKAEQKIKEIEKSYGEEAL